MPKKQGDYKGRHRLKWLTLTLIGTFIIGGCSLLPREPELLKPPLVAPVEQRVVLAKVEEKEISNKIIGTATFEPTNISYEQFTETGGVVDEILVAAGDYVYKDQVLVRLNNEGLDISFKEAQLDAEKKKLALQQAMSSRDESMISIRALELEISEMKLAKVSTAFHSRELTAAMDGGVVYVANLERGDQIEAHQTLVSIANLSEMRLFYTTSRTNVLMDVQVGMPVDVTFRGEQIKGRVVQTPATAPEAANDQLAEIDRQRIYIALEDMPDDAKFGDHADISITLQHKEKALVIPKGSLRSYLGRTYVQIVDGENRYEQDVLIGIETDTEVEILEGLRIGQDVVIR